MRKNGIFEVDTHGMRAVALRRGLGALVLELIQNGLDENITTLEVALWQLSRGRYGLRVTDDAPDGFKNLAEAYTLYSPSKKAADAEKRGQFNVGEKFVIAACDVAMVISTTGGYSFDDEGRHTLRRKREAGTEFYGELRTNQDEVAEALELVRRVIVPEGVTLTVNDEQLDPRPAIASQTSVNLPTWLISDEGIMRPTRRNTTVSLHQPLPGTRAMLYEMGLPVVETGDLFDINVHQRVLLSQDRDNVTPAYLKAVRAIALNLSVEANRLDAETASQVWVRQAMGDERTSAEAVRKVMDLRFGEARVAHTPGDPEANNRAVAAGYRVVYARDLTPEERANVKQHDLLRSSAEVTPAHRMTGSDDPDATPNRTIEPDKWRDGMRRIAGHARWLGRELLGCDVSICFINEPVRRAQVSAAYGPGQLTFNVGTLGYKWFDRPNNDPEVNALLIHEFAHHYCENHLSDKMLDAMCDVGARMVTLALEHPERFGK